jgi:hypothetical protein
MRSAAPASTPGEPAMMESETVTFRSHVHSADNGVAIVIDTRIPMLRDGLLSFRIRPGIPPEQLHDLIALLREQVERIEFQRVAKPIFEKV